MEEAGNIRNDFGASMRIANWSSPSGGFQREADSLGNAIGTVPAFGTGQYCAD